MNKSYQDIDLENTITNYKKLLESILKDKYGVQVLDNMYDTSNNPVQIPHTYEIKSSFISIDDSFTSNEGLTELLPEPYSSSSDILNISDATEDTTDQKIASKIGKRLSISKENRDFLEKIFQTKRAPNRVERSAIAQQCGITPLQVRVWFTNKRMRSKDTSISKAERNLQG